MTFLFERLDVYKRALALAESVPELTKHLSRPYWHVADQLNRASLSIALNIAEGNGRGTDADKRRFYMMARGSVSECVPLVELCQRKGLLSPQKCVELRQDLIDISKMLWGMISHVSAPDTVREPDAEYT